MGKLTHPWRLVRLLLVLLLVQSSPTGALNFNAGSNASIKQACHTIIEYIMGVYNGPDSGGEPGLLPGSDGSEYYWWTGGGLFSGLVQYWASTGDSSYNHITYEAIYTQAAINEGGYFEPLAEKSQLGNDDISFWAFGAMEASEYRFPLNPPKGEPQWLEMVQGVFNRQVQRWNNDCSGGLNWQVSNLSADYNYKNSISNGCFLNLGARLARFTGNDTYAHWAEKTYDWMVSKALISEDPAGFQVVDGIDTSNCSVNSHVEQWSYNTGVLLYGAAMMYNYTNGSDTWKTRTQGLLDGAKTFFKTDAAGNRVVSEVICEPQQTCKIDQTFFKGFLIRWMYATTKVADFTTDQVHQMLQYTAQAAASVCTGDSGYGGVECGEKWYESYDGITGVGQNLNAFTAISELAGLPYPVKLQQSLTKSNNSAGTGRDFFIIDNGDEGGNVVIIPTTADKAGAAIVTILLAGFTFAGAWWMVK